MDRSTLKLKELTDAILTQMDASRFMESTRGFYTTLFNKLCRMAKERGDQYYTIELGQAFINDQSHVIPQNTERYHHERSVAYKRCIKFIESYLETGVVDWSPAQRCAAFPIKSDEFRTCFSKFLAEMEERKLKPNTIEGYRRVTYYFIEYLEGKGYKFLIDIKSGDVVAFIAVICKERYQTTSLGSHMSGLKLFLSMFRETEPFLLEIPEHLPKKRDILKVYSDDEYNRIIAHLEKADGLSFRNKAITILAMNTGLRAVDICAIRLQDIDWEHNIIHITQRKTGRAYDIPLTEAIGNVIVDYLLNERPASNQDFVFLRSIAPYGPLMSHTGIRNILFNVVNDSDVEANGRSYGTRITRHSVASRMLRNGVPFPVISEALGHGNKNSVMIYITTDDVKLAGCTLPLPRGGVYHG